MDKAWYLSGTVYRPLQGKIPSGTIQSPFPSKPVLPQQQKVQVLSRHNRERDRTKDSHGGVKSVGQSRRMYSNSYCYATQY